MVDERTHDMADPPKGLLLEDLNNREKHYFAQTSGMSTKMI